MLLERVPGRIMDFGYLSQFLQMLHYSRKEQFLEQCTWRWLPPRDKHFFRRYCLSIPDLKMPKIYGHHAHLSFVAIWRQTHQCNLQLLWGLLYRWVTKWLQQYSPWLPRLEISAAMQNNTQPKLEFVQSVGVKGVFLIFFRTHFRLGLGTLNTLRTLSMGQSSTVLIKASAKMTSCRLYRRAKFVKKIKYNDHGM